MKPLFLLLCLAATARTMLAAEPLVRFANGDQLPGSIDSFDGTSLVWDSPYLEKPAPFLLTEVLDLTLPGGLPDQKVDHEATLTLTNGDVVRGQLAAVNDQSVTLDTWFAGRLSFNRLMVAALKVDGRTHHSFRGPTGIDGWVHSTEPAVWSYQRGALVSARRGGVARKEVLSAECSLAFDVAWKGDAVSLKLMLFTDDPSTDNPSTGYEISFQGGTIYMRNCQSRKYLGSAHSVALAEQDRARIEVRASRKSGKFCVFIDNRPVEVWSDPDFEEAGEGTCLHFVAVEDSTPLRVSDIVVSPWDGVIREMPAPRQGVRFGRALIPDGDDNSDEQPAPPPPDPAGRMELANGDAVEGEVESIDNGVITLKTPLGDFKLPVARLRTVALGKVDLERAIRRNGDIRAWFADGGSLVFRLDALGPDTLTGSSQNFGTAVFKREAFTRVEFNIHDPALESRRPGGEW
jgi:hypothetical protein